MRQWTSAHALQHGLYWRGTIWMLRGIVCAFGLRPPGLMWLFCHIAPGEFVYFLKEVYWPEYARLWWTPLNLIDFLGTTE